METTVLQAVLDAIAGTIDTSTQISDHPNVKFAMMQRLKLLDAAEMLWIVMANVSGGDWSQQSSEWQEAAARWRDNYFSLITPKEREVMKVDTNGTEA
jgi:hypothetical protein